MKKPFTKYLILDSLRSSENVGSIFRTADATGVEKIYLCGYTPAPTDRFGRDNTKLIKTSLGAEKIIPWERWDDINTLLQELKSKKCFLVAVEQYRDSVCYEKAVFSDPTAFVFGNEVNGLSNEVLQSCDKIAEIPMRGEKESLNVAVSVGVMLYQAIQAS